jgi:hypothetical protein
MVITIFYWICLRTRACLSDYPTFVSQLPLLLLEPFYFQLKKLNEVDCQKLSWNFKSQSLLTLPTYRILLLNFVSFNCNGRYSFQRKMIARSNVQNKIKFKINITLKFLSKKLTRLAYFINKQSKKSKRFCCFC